jgi:hypothetical protein
MQVKDISDLEALSAVAGAWQQDVSIWDLLPEGPHKVQWRKIEQLYDRKLIDYGTSLNGAWLTPEGIELLTELGGTPTGPFLEGRG